MATKLSSEVSATTSLPAPSGLSLDSSVRGEISLSWVSNSTDESGFRIYRSTNSGVDTSSTLVADVLADTTSYTDTGLSDGVEYFYRISSYTQDTESLSSESSEITVLPEAENIELSRSDSLSASVTASINNGQYRWQVRKGNSDTWGNVAEKTTQVGDTDTSFSLKPTQKYEVRVRTETQDTTGSWRTGISTAHTERYDGNSWKWKPMMVYDGSAWKPVFSLKVYDGTGWTNK